MEILFKIKQNDNVSVPDFCSSHLIFSILIEKEPIKLLYKSSD